MLLKTSVLLEKKDSFGGGFVTFNKLLTLTHFHPKGSFFLFNLRKCFLSNYFCENIFYFGHYLICNIRENAEISVYLLHWHLISFTVPNTLDWVTFLLLK